MILHTKFKVPDLVVLKATLKNFEIIVTDLFFFIIFIHFVLLKINLYNLGRGQPDDILVSSRGRALFGLRVTI